MSGSRIIYTPEESKRPPPRSLKKRILVVVVTVFFLVVLVGIFLLLRHPRLQIHSIVIFGIETIPESEVQKMVSETLRGNFLFLFPRSSFFLFSEADIFQNVLHQFPKIHKLSIQRQFPDILNIQIQERRLWAIVCDTAGEGDGLPEKPVQEEPDAKDSKITCVYVDTEGIAYENAPSSVGALITKMDIDGRDLRLGASILDAKFIERIETIRRSLAQNLNLDIIGYEYFASLSKELAVVTSEGFSIQINHGDDIERVSSILKTLFDEEIKEKRSRLDYIDARFGNKVFYKLQRGIK